MSQISQMLVAKAEEIRLSSPEEVAVEHLKQAGYSEVDARLQVAQHIMEKEATAALTTAGVDIEQAVSMVKAAKINLKDLVSYEQAAADVHISVNLLKQAAAYIEELEANVEELEADLTKTAAERLTQEVVLPSSIMKAASSGAFTKEDLAELQNMNQGLLTKVASAMDEPWSMGSGVGMAREKTDPMLDFLMG